MRIIKGWDRKEVCGISVLVPMGEKNIDFSKLISLNDSSLFQWEQMEGGDFTVDGLVQLLTAEYEVDEATARTDVENLISKLRKEKLVVD